MRDGEKNRLFGLLDGERGAVGEWGSFGCRGVTKASDRRAWTWKVMTLESGMTRGRMVRLCEASGAMMRHWQAGGHDGASGAERVGRRAGRGGYDDTVAVIGSDHLPVDPGFDDDHPGAVALDGELVECQIGIGLLGEYALDVEQRAGFGLYFSFGDLLEEEPDVAVWSAGEESEVPGVDPHDGDRGTVESVYAFEQGSVAAVADHERVGRLLADLRSVNLPGWEIAPGSVSENGCKFHIYGEIESEAFDGSEHFAEHFGFVGDPGPGKKYDFHRRSFEKIRNFTTPKPLSRQASRSGVQRVAVVANIVKGERRGKRKRSFQV